MKSVRTQRNPQTAQHCLEVIDQTVGALMPTKKRCLRMRRARLSAPLCLLIAALLSALSMRVSAESEFAPSSRSTTSVMDVEKAASAWGVTEAEYQRYLDIMSGKRGTWTPSADPLLALGVQADSAGEMRRFAELYVRQEFRRTERELAFQREVSAAWKRLYPAQPRVGSMPPVRRAAVSQNMGLISDRAAVVVTAHCNECSQVVRYYLGLVAGESPIKAVDIYISDSQGEDTVLRDWVDKNDVAIELLRAGKVTVNHAESHAAITNFPTIYERQIDGQWQQKSSF